MNRFISDRILMDIEIPDGFVEEFSSLIPFSGKVVGTLSEISKSSMAQKYEVSLPNNYSNKIFAPDEIQDLQLLYSKLYSLNQVDDTICSAYRKYQTEHINNTVLGCHKSRSASSSIVLAQWHHDLHGMHTSQSSNAVEHRPVRINYFARHMLSVDGVNKDHILVSVSWFKKHRDRDCFGKPITVWECDIFETTGFCFIPIEYIICRTVSLVDVINNGAHALIVCPCINF